MKRWMIWLLSPAKGILSFLFPLSVKIDIALYISIINWTVMLFYKYLCSFWKRYLCMHVCFYPCSVIIICSSFSFLFLFSLRFLSLYWYLLFVLIDHRKGKKASYYCCCLFSLSAENTSCFCTYIYINQKKCECLRAVFFFFLYWPNLAPTLLLSWFFYSLLHMPTYKNRVCIYIHTHKKESTMVYIEGRCTILYTYPLIFLLIILIY